MQDPFGKAQRQFHQNLQSAAPSARIVVATADQGLTTSRWNHGKIFSADSRIAFVSGINPWSAAYLQYKNPVTDLGMTVQGAAAGDATNFADVLWRDVCHVGAKPFSWSRLTPDTRVDCPAKAPRPPTDAGVATANIPILSVGQLGVLGDGKTYGRQDPHAVSEADRRHATCRIPPFDRSINGDPNFDGKNAALAGIYGLVRSAKKSVFVSQVDMAIRCDRVSYDVRLFQALADRIANNVPVTFVVSNFAAGVGSSPFDMYSSLITPEKTKSDIKRYVRRVLPTDAAAEDAVCKNLTIKKLRLSPSDRWPDVKGRLGQYSLHTKLYSVDDEAFYIGSTNAFQAAQQEFGYLVEDKQASSDLNTAFIAPENKYSKPAKIC